MDESGSFPLPLGSHLVARAWRDPDFATWLKGETAAVLAEHGCHLQAGTNLIVLANTPELHHAVVCTLCSCYPTTLLGMPPFWYRSAEYRRRMARDPRDFLARQFDLHIPAKTEIRVYDSTYRDRYLVLPLMPAGFEGVELDDLARCVTLDSLIGTGIPGVESHWRNRPFGDEAEIYSDHRTAGRLLLRCEAS